MSLGTIAINGPTPGSFSGVGQAKAPIRKGSETTSSDQANTSSSAVKVEISMMKQTPGLTMFKEMSIYAGSARTAGPTNDQDSTATQMKVEMVMMKQTAGLTLLRELSVYGQIGKAVAQIGRSGNAG